MAHIANWVVLQMEGVLVTLHVPLPRKNFVANVAGKLAPFAFVDLRDVDPQIFLVPKIFVTHPAHKFGGGRFNSWLIFFCTR